MTDVELPFPKVRADHGDTAHQAATQIAPTAGTLRARVLDRLREHPSTDEELQDDLGMNQNTERPRRVELVEQGQIRDSGMRAKTRSGRSAIVWEVCS